MRGGPEVECHSGIGRLRAAFGLLFAAAVVLPARAQAPAIAFELTLADGSAVEVTALEGDLEHGISGRVGDARRTFAASTVLAIHGVAVQRIDQAVAWLGGGDIVCGMLVGGDSEGDHLTMLSPTLGSIDVAIDRLEGFVTPGHGALTLADLALPTGVGEAVFVPARVGHDLVTGTMHRFTDRGLLFAGAGKETAKPYALADFLALRIAEPQPRATPPAALLVTRTGDRLGVRVRNFSATGVRCVLEGERTVEVRYADLACLCLYGGAVFLSDLQPVAVTESGIDGPVVYPWQRDRSAIGGALVAAGRTYGKGLGVHSRSRLEYRVPANTTRFCCRVAFDDSALGLPVVPAVDVRILVNGRVAFAHDGLVAGGKPRDSGLLAVQPGDTLTLEVDCGRGRDLGDRVDWLCPVFLAAAQ